MSIERIVKAGKLLGLHPDETRKRLKNRKCVMCNKDATEFRDDLSRKEYNLSGLCQQCQDGVFGW